MGKSGAVEQFVEIQLRNRSTDFRSTVRITVRTEGESRPHDRYFAAMNYLAGLISGQDMGGFSVDHVRASKPREVSQ